MFFFALFCLEILWIEGRGFDEYGIMLKRRWMSSSNDNFKRESNKSYILINFMFKQSLQEYSSYERCYRRVSHNKQNKSQSIDIFFFIFQSIYSWSTFWTILTLIHKKSSFFHSANLKNPIFLFLFKQFKKGSSLSAPIIKAHLLQ